MNHYEQIIFLLGHVKATIENISFIAMHQDSTLVLDLLIEFEQDFNQKIKKIFN